jgi:hypothetical protein
MALSGPHLLSLQLDRALLCEQLGARGEVDRLAAQALATSSSIVEQQGLQQMLVRAGLLLSCCFHMSTLAQAAACSYLELMWPTVLFRC